MHGMRIVYGLLALLFGTVGAAWSENVEGDQFALLIGISDYGGVGPEGADRSLLGPRNDIIILHQALRERGVPAENIRVLADSLEAESYAALVKRVGARANLEPEDIEILVDQVEEPDFKAHGTATYANIEEGFSWLRAVTGAGDKAIVYFSGHGSYVPDLADASEEDREADGRDEILLPIDIGTWNRENQVVENQVVDDQIGAWLEPLIEAGVFVWMIADACHTGTVQRATPTDDLVMTRAVKPIQDLGIPGNLFDGFSLGALFGGDDDDDEATDDNAPTPPEETGAGQAGEDVAMSLAGGEGALVGFFAAQAAQQALETPQPLQSLQAGRVQHGLMTWNLVQALRRGDTADFASLARRVAAGYSFARGQYGQRVPNPQFTGALQSPLFFGGGEARVHGFEIGERGLQVMAGLLDGLSPGAVLRVALRQPDGSLKTAFHARITEAGAETARFDIIEDDPDLPNHLPAIMAEQGLPLALFERWMQARERYRTLEARVVERAPMTVMRVWLGQGAAQSLRDSLDQAAERLAERFAVVVEETAEPGPADLQLVVEDALTWFLWQSEPGGEAGSSGTAPPLALPLDTLTAQRLSDVLLARATAERLLGLAEAGGQPALGGQLSLRVFAKSSRSDADGTCTERARRGLDKPPEGARLVASPRGDGRLPRFETHHCDAVYVSITNTAQTAIAVTPLLINAWSEITVLDGYPRAGLEDMVIAPGKTQFLAFTENTHAATAGFQPPGQRHVALIARPHTEDAVIGQDFRHLQRTLPDEPADLFTLTRGRAAPRRDDKAGSASEETAAATIPERVAVGEAAVMALSFQAHPPADGR